MKYAPLKTEVFEAKDLEKAVELKSPRGWNIPYISNVSEGHRMVLLCLHGFGGSKGSSMIVTLRDDFDEKGIGVVSFDWPQHGDSDAPDCALSVESCLDDLDTVLKRLSQSTHLPIACFATSFGGYLATLYRNEHPEAFTRLILRSPALKADKVLRGITKKEDLERAERGERIILGEGNRPKMTLDRSFYDSLSRHDAYSAAPPSPENILIIQGTGDTIVSPEDTRGYAEKNGIRLISLENAGHEYDGADEKKRVIAETEEFLLG